MPELEQHILAVYTHNRQSITVEGNEVSISMLRDALIPIQLVKGISRYIKGNVNQKIDSLNYTQLKELRLELAIKAGEDFPLTDPGARLVGLSQWIDAGNMHRSEEARQWGRLAKLLEEGGEVVEAYIGLTGQNPRKGVHKTLEDVNKELFDVAITALGAYESLNGHPGNALERLDDAILGVANRAREAAEADQPNGLSLGEMVSASTSEVSKGFILHKPNGRTFEAFPIMSFSGEWPFTLELSAAARVFVDGNNYWAWLEGGDTLVTGGELVDKVSGMREHVADILRRTLAEDDPRWSQSIPQRYEFSVAEMESNKGLGL